MERTGWGEWREQGGVSGENRVGEWREQGGVSHVFNTNTYQQP